MKDQDLEAKKQELEQLVQKIRAAPVFQAAGLMKEAGIVAAEIVCELAAREVNCVKQ